MGRKATIKNIKTHLECACGKNIVEDYTIVQSLKHLKQCGFKKRIYKNTKEVFWFLNSETICDTCFDNLEY